MGKKNNIMMYDGLRQIPLTKLLFSPKPPVFTDTVVRTLKRERDSQMKISGNWKRFYVFRWSFVIEEEDLCTFI
ncbi:hypothetical protein Chor_008053 [Crotalus horridus]